MRNALAITMLILASQFLHAQLPKDTIYTQVEQMPFFAGCQTFGNDLVAKKKCSDQKLVLFISRNLVYPEIAKETGIEGTVVANFIIDESGALTNPNVLMDIGGGCGPAALELLSKMPKWDAGKHLGQAVKVKLNLPIHFELKEPEPDNSTSYTLTWGSLKGDETTVDALKNSLENTVYVRDVLGNDRYIDELAFTFKKNRRLINAKSRGKITPELIKVVDKSKVGGIFTITASIQDGGDFIYVTRSFEIAE